MMTKYEIGTGFNKIVRNIFAGLGFVWCMLIFAFCILVGMPGAMLMELSDDVKDLGNRFENRLADDLGYYKRCAEEES